MAKDGIYLRIDKDMKEELEKLAIERKRSLNNFIVSVLANYLKTVNKKKDD